MGQIRFGRAQTRVEDGRFLTGRGQYLADLAFDGQLHAAFLRSPHAHAKVRGIDTKAAAAMPGVVAVYICSDYRADGGGPVPCLLPATNVDGSPGAEAPHWPLAADRVRYVGEPVAMVVAESETAARDAVESIVVDFDALPPVTETAAALAADAPLLWPERPDNRAFHWGIGEAEATEAAFAGAAVTVSERLVNNRVHALPLEPRGAVAVPEVGDGADGGRFALHLTSQNLDVGLSTLAQMLGWPKSRIRLRTHDIGGGFGLKFFTFPEYALVLWAASRLARPVGWISDRAEAMLSDVHARDHVTEAALALDQDGHVVGLRATVTAAMGAYLSNFAPFIATQVGNPWITGWYRIPAARVDVHGVFTNTAWVDAYRGAGQPEASYVIERLMDMAARRLGLDPAELRRRNMVAADAQPYRTAMGGSFTGTDFGALLDRLVADAGWSERRILAMSDAGHEASSPLRRGVGLACYLERTEGVKEDHAWVEVTPEGEILALTGTQSTGQGHETVFATIVADHLGVPLEKVRVVQGDTDRIAKGHGTGGSRSLAAASPAFVQAADNMVEMGRAHAAELLEAAAADIAYADGRFTVAGTDLSADLFQVAAKAQAATGAPLKAEGIYVPNFAPTFPSGAHLCEVEVDAETGRVRILRYLAVNDFGRVLNPMLVEGQVHGGVAQGIGQALMEGIAYDAESGQLLTGSLMDYALPRADDLPAFETDFLELPQPDNPLGIKGCGESGCIAAPSAVVNAVLDALSPLGVRHLDMPLTPEKVWQAIRAAAAQGEPD
ncbi:xanthine dehydrogenase family protein molybdopterin-binding subunit [Marinibaculum pumilum]|uniref:Xanthine dehydrogenase family protein molybdopterin-binding subunit n=1 Tax=Marinibaculum pumilum TaxID=1766165 RepID=A0ABV7KTS3_9PROT